MHSAVSIQTQDFDAGEQSALLAAGRTDIGAIASFVGLVRGDDGLIAMTLEHYPAMTKAEIERHVAEACVRWPLVGVRVIHRVGRLLPGERIVFVGAASAHRFAAFEATQFLMDYLKTRAPFWKSEERASGISWVEAKTEDNQALARWQK